MRRGPLPVNTDQTHAASTAGTVKRFLTAFWVPLVLILAALGVSGTVTVLHTDQMSPVDEWVYLDYLYKFPTQGIVHRGEAIGDEALDIMACNGVKVYGPMGPDCGSDYQKHLAEFPYQGQTSADLYTPFYFAITWVVGGAIHLLSGIDLVTSWRLTGPLWQGLSVFVLFLLFRQWKVAPIATLALGLALIASPFSWWTYSYVSTDAPSFTFGVLLLFAATKYVRGEWSGWWIVASSALAIAFKATNILSIGVVALYLIVQWLYERRSTTWDGLRTRRPGFANRRWFALPGTAVLAGVAASVIVVAWTFIRSAVAISDAPDQGTTAAFGIKELLDQMVNFLPNTLTSNVNLAGAGVLAYPVPGIVSASLSFITIAGVVGAFWTLQRGAKEIPLVVSIALASVLAAPVLAVVLYFSQGEAFALPPRYGASILGGMLLLTGLTIRYPPAAWATLTYSSALALFVVGTAFHYA